jgi:hypothetical protein
MKLKSGWGQSVSLGVRHAHISDPWPVFITVAHLLMSWCVAPSPTRGRVCNLLVRLLLGLARAVTPGPSPAQLMNIFYSHSRLPQPGARGRRTCIPRNSVALGESLWKPPYLPWSTHTELSQKSSHLEPLSMDRQKKELICSYIATSVTATAIS